MIAVRFKRAYLLKVKYQITLKTVNIIYGDEEDISLSFNYVTCNFKKLFYINSVNIRKIIPFILAMFRGSLRGPPPEG